MKGTRASAYQEAKMILIDEQVEEIWNPADTISKYMNNANEYKDYLPKYWRDITPEQINLGHGGMDFYMAATFIDCVLNKKEMPIDVYDAASWYAITPLSAKSIKHHGKVYKIPDFTKGKYKTRKKTEAFEKEASYEEYI